MPKNEKITEELKSIIETALFQMQKLTLNGIKQETDFIQVISLFLQSIISTVADLAELSSPGASSLVYADVEACARLGGLQAIKKMQSENGSTHYSVSNIPPDDIETAMNYLGKEMATALFKGIYELPKPLRNPEMLLKGTEALVANLISQNFDNPHQILESFCDHVYMTLDDLERKTRVH